MDYSHLITSLSKKAIQAGVDHPEIEPTAGVMVLITPDRTEAFIVSCGDRPLLAVWTHLTATLIRDGYHLQDILWAAVRAYEKEKET